MATRISLVRKLISALEVNGVRLLLQQKPFVGASGHQLTYFVLVQPIYDVEKHRYVNNEIYASASLVRVLFYLVDSYSLLTKNELAKTTPEWEELRKSLTHTELESR